MIKCQRCREIKLPEEFNKDKSGPYGKSKWCKSCTKESYAEWKRKLTENICNPCKCGCGELVKNPVNDYIMGHHVRGKPSAKRGRKDSNETRRKKSEAHSGEKNSFFGKTHTEETKRKLREARKKYVGKNHPSYGKSRSEESKQKQREKMSGANHPMFDKHHSEKTIQKMKIAQLGEKHWNWQDGISFEPYCPKFNYPNKEIIRHRDNYTCQNCGVMENGNSHTVHHIHYDKDNCNPDLITLCRSCNTKANTKRDYHESFYMRKLAYRKIPTEISNMETELGVWNYGVN